MLHVQLIRGYGLHLDATYAAESCNECGTSQFDLTCVINEVEDCQAIHYVANCIHDMHCCLQEHTVTKE